jgi:hypothetical protein
MESNKEKDCCDDENFSPNLEDGLQRKDSDRSWKASQGEHQEPPKISKEKLFLVSLGTIMSLFT